MQPKKIWILHPWFLDKMMFQGWRRAVILTCFYPRSNRLPGIWYYNVLQSIYSRLLHHQWVTFMRPTGGGHTIKATAVQYIWGKCKNYEVCQWRTLQLYMVQRLLLLYPPLQYSLTILYCTHISKTAVNYAMWWWIGFPLVASWTRFCQITTWQSISDLHCLQRCYIDQADCIIAIL